MTRCAVCGCELIDIGFSIDSASCDYCRGSEAEKFFITLTTNLMKIYHDTDKVKELVRKYTNFYV